MPSKSKAQQHLMAAAIHGATFSMAAKVRASMTTPQLQDFAKGPVKAPKLATPGHPHLNLGKYLHPKKAR